MSCVWGNIKFTSMSKYTPLLSTFSTKQTVSHDSVSHICFCTVMDVFSDVICVFQIQDSVTVSVNCTSKLPQCCFMYEHCVILLTTTKLVISCHSVLLSVTFHFVCVTKYVSYKPRSSFSDTVLPKFTSHLQGGSIISGRDTNFSSPMQWDQF
jgi:hypothetical protein